MINYRVIPVLLLQNKGLVKTRQFKNPVYVGDPINAIKIYNEKEVDELVFLDINASKEKRPPDFTLLEKIASECFMPLGYGGGISSLDEVKRILNIGIEKVIFNDSLFDNQELLKQAAKLAGSQSVVVSIDVKKSITGKRRIYRHTTKSIMDISITEYARCAEEAGAGEIFLNSVDQDGMMGGYDLEMIRKVADTVNIPVVACGGAGQLSHFREAVSKGGASAVAAGSMFVFHGPHKAVLINYPGQDELKEIFKYGE